jgi:hypothetical protein
MEGSNRHGLRGRNRGSFHFYIAIAITITVRTTTAVNTESEYLVIGCPSIKHSGAQEVLIAAIVSISNEHKSGGIFRRAEPHRYCLCGMCVVVPNICSAVRLHIEKGPILHIAADFALARCCVWRKASKVGPSDQAHANSAKQPPVTIPEFHVRPHVVMVYLSDCSLHASAISSSSRNVL